MTRSSTSKLVTQFVDPKRQLRSRRKFTPSSIHNIYSFSYESEASETESEEMGKVDIDTLTMEQYMALTRGNNGLGVDGFRVRSEIATPTRDAIMLLVFPFTFMGATRRWKDKVPTGSINTYDLLEKAFIQKYCPPLKTAKQLEEIHNFKKEMDKKL
ncbi:hypothetical protein Tco_0818484 [Tanacetum coccineum]